MVRYLLKFRHSVVSSSSVDMKLKDKTMESERFLVAETHKVKSSNILWQTLGFDFL